jgi:uncharacterized repeat protein (TIGR02543 family)
MKLKYILGTILIATLTSPNFLELNASEQYLVAVKQDNFSGTATQLDQIFRRSGNTLYSSNTVSLVQNGENQAGGFFSRNRIFMNNTTTAGFSSYFEITQSGGHNKYEGMPGFGDGFTFVISRDFNVLGAAGGAIGYGGITNSVAILFDTFDNGGQPPMCISLGINGVQGACSFHGGYAGVTYRIWVDYSRVNKVMELRLNASNSTRPVNATRTYTDIDFNNVGNEFYAGFTSSTGGAVQNTIIRRWYFTGYFTPNGINPNDSANMILDPTPGVTPVIEPIFLEDKKRWSFRPDPLQSIDFVSFYAYGFNGSTNRSIYFDDDFPEVPLNTSSVNINLYAVSISGSLSQRAEYPFHKGIFNLNYPGGGFIEQFFPESRPNYPITENLSLPIPQRPGYTFKGWGTSSTQIRNLKSTHSFLRNTLFFAQWTLEPFTVTFDTNGGTSIDPILTDIQSGFTLPNPPEKEMSIFAGWYVDEDLTMPFDENNLPTGNITLYAKWNVPQYQLTVYCDENQPDIFTVNYGDVFATIPENNRDFIFKGWYLDSTFTMPYTNEAINADITIYARWLDITLVNQLIDLLQSKDINDLTLNDQSWLNGLNAIKEALSEEQLAYLDEVYEDKLDLFNEYMNDLIFMNTFIFQVDALPRIAYLESENAIREALAVYQTLTPRQLSLLPVDRQHHLNDLNEQLIRLLNAKEVENKILNLPIIPELTDLIDISNTYSDYLSLTDMEKELINPLVKQRLMNLVALQPDLMVIQGLVELLDDIILPLTLNQTDLVASILSAYGQLTQAQRDFLPAYYQNLLAHISTMNIHLDRADAFEDNLLNYDGVVTEENKETYEAILTWFDSLHEDQIALLTEETIAMVETIREGIRSLNNRDTNPVDPEEPEGPENPEEPEEPEIPIDPIPEEPPIRQASFPWIIVFVSISIIAGSYIIKEKSA